MSDNTFNCGYGHLSQRVAKAVKSETIARLVNHTEPGCLCGHGCRGGCRLNEKHWFVGPDQGEPFNSQLARDVAAVVARTATIADRKLLNI